MIDYTLQDLLNKYYNKINELIENAENQNKILDEFREKGIKEEVIKQLQIYIQDNNFNMDGGIF